MVRAGFHQRQTCRETETETDTERDRRIASQIQTKVGTETDVKRQSSRDYIARETDDRETDTDKSRAKRQSSRD